MGREDLQRISRLISWQLFPCEASPGSSPFALERVGFPQKLL
ncbi:MAG: hypothetical protein UZ16_OP3001002116 [Candidatus Hinthialibacteria bacterium OLB16]|nr:MAG: hypothetical protein UZ16_OP3001002116 [Candidatus Hinthialibacteria bacterium OLB16]